MSIDIANMILNIGETKDFDWSNFWAALFGALAAFSLGAIWEIWKKNQIDKQNFKRVYYMTGNLLSTFLNLQKNVINKNYNAINKYTTIEDYEKNVLNWIVTQEYKYSVDYSLIFLDGYNEYVLVLVDAINQQVGIFNKTLISYHELLDTVKQKEYENFDEFVKDSKLKINIENAIIALKANSNILICFAYALFTILSNYRCDKLSKEKFVNLKFDQEQIDAILKNGPTLDCIPDYIKEGFPFLGKEVQNAN